MARRAGRKPVLAPAHDPLRAQFQMGEFVHEQDLPSSVEDDEAVAEALTLLRASPGMAKAKHFLADYAAQARQELALLPDVPGRRALETLAGYTVSRHG